MTEAEIVLQKATTGVAIGSYIAFAVLMQPQAAAIALLALAVTLHGMRRA